MKGKRILDSEEVRRLYVDEGWTERRIAEHLGVTRSGVEMRLRSDGVPSRGRQTGTSFDKNAIRDFYVNRKMSMRETAKAIGASTSTVSYLLRQEGILPRSISILDLEEVRRLYVDEGWTRRRIADHFGVTWSAVASRMQRGGVPLRPERNVTKFDTGKLRHLYVNQKLSIHETARAIGASYSSAWRLLRQEGIPLRKNGNSRLDSDDVCRP